MEARRLGVRIRRGQPSDAPAIAGVNIRGWQWAYRGQIPDGYLDALTANLERGTQGWERQLAGQRGERVWVAEANGTIVGFVATTPSRDDDATKGIGEVRAIYLEADWAGKGVGRLLFRQAVEHLRLLGYEKVTLWVLATNERAQRFYEAAGFHPDGAVKVDHGANVDLHELRYRIDLGSTSRG